MTNLHLVIVNLIILYKELAAHRPCISKREKGLPFYTFELFLFVKQQKYLCSITFELSIGLSHWSKPNQLGLKRGRIQSDEEKYKGKEGEREGSRAKRTRRAYSR